MHFPIALLWDVFYFRKLSLAQVQKCQVLLLWNISVQVCFMCTRWYFYFIFQGQQSINTGMEPLKIPAPKHWFPCNLKDTHFTDQSMLLTSCSSIHTLNTDLCCNVYLFPKFIEIAVQNVVRVDLRISEKYSFTLDFCSKITPLSWVPPSPVVNGHGKYFWVYFWEHLDIKSINIQWSVLLINSMYLIPEIWYNMYDMIDMIYDIYCCNFT